ncbi:MAG TPA: DUF222 domain-containing protein [Acidimicrobiales bacterium]|nr:DUF222 domain-containing protein [Acidimicrobiales bacterium]
MDERAERREVGDQLEVEIAEVCGLMNATAGRLVRLLASVLETGCWQVSGIHSPTQWVAWKCGVSPSRARSLVATARRRDELVETTAAFEAGELGEDQVAVIARRAPAGIDAEVATLARSATVSQLRRVLGSYPFETAATRDEADPAGTADEARRVSFGYDDDGSWHLSAELPADEGAVVERALAVARDELFRAGQHDIGTDARPSDVGWADALVTVADRSLGAEAASRPHHDRHVVLLHLGTDANGSTASHLHLGPGLSEGLRRFVGCDSRIRPVIEAGGRAVSVGRALRTVPERTRIAIEERDRGCRVPGCDHSRWIHVHHIRHWEDGGPSDTGNLIALCPRHHRLHHLGRLGVAGDADDPDGMVFTDERGRPLSPCGRPRPPGPDLASAAAQLRIPAGGWSHPSGERLDPTSVRFTESAAARH